jgi:hypothetical protein
MSTRIPRAVHVPWLVISVVGFVAASWGRGFWSAATPSQGAALVALQVWLACASLGCAR